MKPVTALERKIQRDTTMRPNALRHTIMMVGCLCSQGAVGASAPADSVGGVSVENEK